MKCIKNLASKNFSSFKSNEIIGKNLKMVVGGDPTTEEDTGSGTDSTDSDITITEDCIII